MRKTIGKKYPVFNEKFFRAGTSNHWCSESRLPRVPERFAGVYHRESISSSEDNFIMFNGDVQFSNERHTMQDKWFMFDEPVVIKDQQQLQGHVYDGDVDFFVRGPIMLESGGSLADPNTGRGIRYPFKIATYYPIRNVLVFRGLVAKEPTDSLIELIDWVFRKVRSVGYKYNERGQALLIGCDPEFNIHDMMDERIVARELFPTGGNEPLGCDGHSQTGEIRPDPADCPLKLTTNISKIMLKAAEILGNDKKLTTGGGGTVDPLGHHIHFNKMVSSEEIELLDFFVGGPSLKIKGAKRPTSEYEVLGRRAVRRQPHGCEYRAPASSLIPELTNALHATAWCVIKKWESLEEGEEFNFEIDDKTQIPTRESYIALDPTTDKRYVAHLEEMWKWANGVGGRKIDPKRDCLQWWVPGREEVKPKPGIKINWSSNIFPDSAKERFISVPEMNKIYDLAIFLLPTTESTGEKILQVCLSDELRPTVNMDALYELKIKYGIDRILGFDHPSRKLGLNDELISHIGTMRKLKNMTIAFAKILCVE